METNGASSRSHGRRIGIEDGGEQAAAACSGFTVRIRALHALDLITNGLGHGCPVVRVSVNNGVPQACVAAQHAKNHSIWRRHALVFKFEAFEWFSIQVAVLGGDPDQPSTTRESKSELGSIGELRLPAKADGYELTQFFQLFQQVRVASSFNRRSASYTLVPAGRIKLRIQFEVAKPAEPQASLVGKTSNAAAVAESPPFRSLFGSSTGFLQNLQLQRKKLKATVVPVSLPDSAAARQEDAGASSTDPGFFARATAILPSDHIVRDDELQFCDQRVIGEGAHSCVRRAILNSARVSRSGDACVAVKEFRYLDASSPPRKVVEAFLHEYRMLTLLPAHCENVAVFEGVLLQPRLAIVMEFCAHGSIAQFMSNTERWLQISLVQKCAIALQLARGIACLHKHRIVHRDIKPHNILLTSNAGGEQIAVKIGDLGSAISHPPDAPPLLEEAGSSGYTAPEVFTGGGYDRKADVWSFAMVIWEVFGSPLRPDNPFVGMDSDEFVRQVSEGVRPNVSHLGDDRQSDTTKSAVQHVIEACWAFNPADRPTMDEVVRMTEQIYAATMPD